MTTRRGICWTVSAALFIGVGLAVFWYLDRPAELLEFSLLDIGQGDAVLIEAPGGQTVLIDGGPGNSVLRRLGEELPFWERRIDLVVLTHPHEDHLAGLNAVLERYEVGAALLTGIESSNQNYVYFLEELERRNIPRLIADQPQRLEVGGLSLDILYPHERFPGNRISNLNNSSVVIKATYGEIDMLLTGDAEHEAEAELLAAGVKLEAEILKAGHHGSETSSGEAFLAAVKPRLVVISSGEGNSYGHPSPRLLRRLERLGIPYRRTDEEGTIRITTDGQAIFQ